MTKSKFLSLNWLDFGKGALLAFIVFLLHWAQETFIPALDVSPDIKFMLIAGIGYIAKNFFEGERNETE